MKCTGCFNRAEFDRELACSIAPVLRMLYDSNGRSVALFYADRRISAALSDPVAFKTLIGTFSDDHIASIKGEPLFIEPDADIAAAFEAYVLSKTHKPALVAVRGLGLFTLGTTKEEASIVIAAFFNMCDNSNTCCHESNIIHKSDEGRIKGKIAVITGGAQGFGKGIAEALAEEGAYIVVADLNYDGAVECAAELNSRFGAYAAVAVRADISDESSVENMIQEAVLSFGGLDVLISNAGVLIAGGLGDMTKEKFDLVTAVNYTGYFLCAKYASVPMKIQHQFAPSFMTDIIEINSKSGLEGSNKNFAYSGSKFGGVGLTQSFALELVEYGIKVNAICPGNLFDGPLWSDPERGLFRQYLDSGKVAGAKTIDDVRRFYETKVPMRRGCTTADVARAVLYAIEQKYETGQAIPVTGGQVMLS